MSENKTKKTLDQLLDEVSYDYLNSPDYIPSEFSLRFMNFIKLVNGPNRDTNKTPPMHLSMLDKLNLPDEYLVNLLFRGSAKTTVFMEYLSLYLAVFCELPHLGKLNGMIYVSDSVDNGVKSARQNIENRYNESSFIQSWVPEARFTDKYIEFTNKNNQPFGIKLYGASTGIRGSKIFGERPKLAVLDDLIGDADAVSKSSMNMIKDTVYRGVMQALNPDNKKVIFNGTPFNKEDIIVEAVESGAWTVNVFPVCEKFPCTREEFKGAWEDRFNYDALMRQYQFYEAQKRQDDFYQELMLRITNVDNRLVKDSDLRWYSIKTLMENRSHFNYYITTDFAVSAKESADYAVISVWALNSNGDWFWVDGVAERVTLDVTIQHLFRLVQEYSPMSVGIEVNGQQGGFISWIETEMMRRNVWFNLASSNNSTPGIRRNGAKFDNFMYVVPLFKQKKFFFPIEKKTDEPMQVFLEQLGLTLKTGFKGKDDFLDTISMLPLMDAVRPGAAIEMQRGKDSIWSMPAAPEISSLSSYIV